MEAVAELHKWPVSLIGNITVAPGTAEISIRVGLETHADWIRLRSKLHYGHCVVSIQPDEFSGIHALRTAIASVCYGNGWSPPPTADDIHRFISSMDYWGRIYNGESVRRDDFQDGDFVHSSWYHYRQLDIVATWIGEMYNTHFRVVYLVQESQNPSAAPDSAYHRLVPGHLTARGDAAEHVVYIHWSSIADGHYQAIVPTDDNTTVTVQKQINLSRNESHKDRQSLTKNTDKRRRSATYELLPRGVSLLWILGCLKRNPFTGNPGPGPEHTIAEGVSMRSLWQRVTSQHGDPSTVRKAKRKAKTELENDHLVSILCDEPGFIPNISTDATKCSKGSRCFTEVTEAVLAYWQRYQQLAPGASHEHAMTVIGGLAKIQNDSQQMDPCVASNSSTNLEATFSRIAAVNPTAASYSELSKSKHSSKNITLKDRRRRTVKAPRFIDRISTGTGPAANSALSASKTSPVTYGTSLHPVNVQVQPWTYVEESMLDDDDLVQQRSASELGPYGNPLQLGKAGSIEYRLSPGHRRLSVPPSRRISRSARHNNRASATHTGTVLMDPMEWKQDHTVEEDL